MDLYLSEMKTLGMRPWVYQVWVDGKVYDVFQSTRPLTWPEQCDVVDGYRDALSGGLPAAS